MNKDKKQQCRMEKMLYKYIVVILGLLSLVASVLTAEEEFIVERNERGSDRLLIVKQGSVKKSSNFKLDGTCFDSKKHIASMNSEIIDCYTGTELQGIGTETCFGGIGIVARIDTRYPVCRIQRIAEVYVWDPNGWKQFQYEKDDFLKKQFSYNQGELHFDNRRNWDGVLMRLFAYCFDNSPEMTCISLKFTGNRTYPLPNSLSDILKPSPTPSPTTITPSTLPTKPPTRPSQSAKRTKPLPASTTQKNTVIVIEKQSSDDEGTNAGLIIGAMLGSIILFAVILFLILYMKRRMRREDYTKRQDPNVYATCDNVYDVRNQNEKSVMITTAAYATPHNEPEYRELERQYDDPSHGVSKTLEERYDVPEQNNELTPRTYSVPRMSKNTGQGQSGNPSSRTYSVPKITKKTDEGASEDYYSTPASQENEKVSKVPLSELYAQVDKTKK